MKFSVAVIVLAALTPLVTADVSVPQHHPNVADLSKCSPYLRSSYADDWVNKSLMQRAVDLSLQNAITTSAESDSCSQHAVRGRVQEEGAVGGSRVHTNTPTGQRWAPESMQTRCDTEQMGTLTSSMMRSPQIIVALAKNALATAAKASSRKALQPSGRSLLSSSLLGVDEKQADKGNSGISKTRPDWSRYRGGAEKVDADHPETTNKKHGLFHREKKNKKKEEKSNTDDGEYKKEARDESASKYVFSVCQPGDGSEQDPDNIPRTFMNMAKGNREVAKAALATTQQWRTENQVDTILQRPHPNFDVCKVLSLHSFLGRDATGHVVFFQRPAVDADEHLEMFTKNNMTNDDILLHYIYVFEYCWNILDPPNSDNEEEEPRTMTSILDLTGLNMSILRHRELVGFVKQFVQMTSTHYPARSYKTLLLNAPSWFGMLYKLLTPLLRESTRAKVSILSRGKHQTEVLREVLGEECLQYLPADILETDRKKLKEGGHSEPPPVPPMEQEIRDFCRARLQDAGVEMNPPC